MTEHDHDAHLAADFPAALDNLEELLATTAASARRLHESARAQWRLDLGTDSPTAKITWLAVQNIASVIHDLQAARERL